MQQVTYPVQFHVDYPDRALDRVSTAFRIFVAIPIAIVLGAVSGGTWQWSSPSRTTTATSHRRRLRARWRWGWPRRFGRPCSPDRGLDPGSPHGTERDTSPAASVTP